MSPIGEYFINIYIYYIMGDNANYSLNKHMDMIIQDINIYTRYVNSILKTSTDLSTTIKQQTPAFVRKI